MSTVRIVARSTRTRWRCPFDPARIADLRGVDGAPVRLIGYDDVVAVVSTAAPGELDEASLSTRLERLDELEVLARSHDAVVASVGAHSVTLPFRLAIIHRGDAGVVDMLRRDVRPPRRQARPVVRARRAGRQGLHRLRITLAATHRGRVQRFDGHHLRPPISAATQGATMLAATRPGGCRLRPPHTPTPS